MNKNAKYIMALDQGTTSSRCVIFDQNGRPCTVAQREFDQIFPKTGWVEHDPMQILNSQLQVMRDAMAQSKLTAADILCIGIANQRETVIVWDRDGVPICNAIVWQCRRTAQRCQRLRQDGHQDMIYARTGLELDPYFCATKLEWILDNVPNARQRAQRGELLFGTVDTWLLYHLTGGQAHATDHTNASRTMLFDIHILDWSDQLLQLFDIPRCMLPQVWPSAHDYGTTSVLGQPIPIRALVGDQQGALMGQQCRQRGDLKNTYGTGCFLLLHTGDTPLRSRHGLLTTLAASTPQQIGYALEGSVFVGGAVVQWLRDQLGLIASARQTSRIAQSVASSEGVFFVPAFVGLGAPHWNSSARGTITGLTRGSNRAHIVRAALESIAFQVHDIFRAMERDLGHPIASLNVDGGASSNDFLMQFQADILGATIARPPVIETTALGAAYLAGWQTGFFDTTKPQKRRLWTPQISPERRQEMLAGWNQALGAATLSK